MRVSRIQERIQVPHKYTLGNVIEKAVLLEILHRKMETVYVLNAIFSIPSSTTWTPKRPRRLVEPLSREQT
jgi:hypothetical protein